MQAPEVIHELSDSSTEEDEPQAKRQQITVEATGEPADDKIDALMGRLSCLRPTPSRARLRRALADADGDVNRAAALLGSSSAQAAAVTPVLPRADSPHCMLLAMGFGHDQARAALDSHGGDVARAADALLSGHAPLQADDAALARTLQAAEYSGGPGGGGSRSNDAADDEEVARALERRLNANAASGGDGGGGGNRKSTLCRYGAACRHRTDGHCPYRHEEPSEAQTRLNAEAKARCARERPPPRRTFDAAVQPLHLNRLGESEGSSRGRTLSETSPPSEIGGEELLWWPPYLQHALFATFGVNYEFVQRLVAGSPASERPNGVVIVTGNDHTTQRAGFDDVTHAPWTIVMPPFVDEAASSSVVQRMERGTMHPKLHLLESVGRSERTLTEKGRPDAPPSSRSPVVQCPMKISDAPFLTPLLSPCPMKISDAPFLTPLLSPRNWSGRFDGGTPESRFLRVVIASANLGPYERKLNNQFWVHDFPPASPPAASPPAASPPAASPPAASPPAASASVRRSDFAADLGDFVGAMLRPAAGLSASWALRLAQYNLTPPPGVHIIASVPGRTPTWDGRYGAQAVRRCLRGALESRPVEARHSLVEFAFSSVGTIDKLMWRPLTEAFRMGAAPTAPECVPLPRATDEPRSSGQDETSAAQAKTRPPQLRPRRDLRSTGQGVPGFDGRCADLPHLAFDGDDVCHDGQQPRQPLVGRPRARPGGARWPME